MNGLKSLRWLALAAIVALSASAPAADDKPKSQSPAEKIRAALELKRTLEVADQPLDKAMELLSKQTGVAFEADQEALGTQLLLRPLPGSGVAMTFSLKSAGVTVKEALERGLAPYSLTYVIVGDKVVVTSPDRVVHLSMRQRVSLQLEDVGFDKALKNLARETGVNIVLDPKFAKEATAGVTLKLQDVPLEAAVATMSSAAGWSSVRLHSVLFVTSTEKAKEMRLWAADLDRSLNPPSAPVAPLNSYALFGTPIGVLGVGGTPGISGDLLGIRGALGVGGGIGGTAPAPVIPRR